MIKRYRACDQMYQGQGQPQNQGAMDQGRNFPMLPPQFANLTPQQLQQLRTQPQFQTIMRNYLQKQQQQMQQQQQQQQQIQPPLSQHPQRQNSQQPQLQQHQHQQLPQHHQQQLPQHQHHQLQQVQQHQQPMGGMYANQNPMMQHMNSQGAAQLPMQQQQQVPGMQQVRGSQLQGLTDAQALQAQQQQQLFQQQLAHGVNSSMRPFAQRQSQQHQQQGPQSHQHAQQHAAQQQQLLQQQAQQIAQQQTQQQIQQQAQLQAQQLSGQRVQQAPAQQQHLPLHGAPNQYVQRIPQGVAIPPGPQNAMYNNLPTHTAQSINSGQVTEPDVTEAIPQNASLHEWSEKLKLEGKEVPTDVLVYESIIEKDSKFLNKMTKQIHGGKKLLDGLVQDIKTYTEIKQLRMNAIALSHKGHFNNSIWGEGYQGYGNGISNTYTRLILPKDTERISRRADIQLTDHVVNEKVKESSKSGKYELVPIRLEFDNERDRFKLRDTFLWNLNESVLPLDKFVTLLLEDYKFIPPSCHDAILSTIKEQLRDYRERPASSMGELRVPLKIDITINNTQLVDQFEWDILNFEENDPEDFATTIADEMKLPGEFTTAIAHSIREQVQLFHKALNLIGYSFDGSVVHEDDIRTHILPPLRVTAPGLSNKLTDNFYSILRNPQTVADNTPTLIKLTQLELDRLDKEMERESRRKRRHNIAEDVGGGGSGSGGRSGTLSRRAAALHGHGGRGGASVLPDLSEIPKTFRTPAPTSILPGGVDLSVPDIYTYNEIAVQRTLIKNPDYQPPVNNDRRNNRVRYNHDPVTGQFLVTIKL